ncbi:MAG: hypothetical protein V4649_16095 [Bacteroidota bacterium]
MSFIKKPLGLLVFVFVFVATPGFAQYKHNVGPFLRNFKNKHRYEIGGNVVMPFGEFTGVVRVNDANGRYVGDSTATRTLTGGMGYGVDLGLSLPFRGTGHISCWAASVHLMANQYMWKNLNQTMNTGGTYVDAGTPVNATTLQIMLPIGVEWKVGNDAILSKRLNFGASLGAGVIPQVNLTALEGVDYIDPGYGWGVRPYAKAEAAFFTGFCWKLRFMYSPGNVNLLDVNRRLTADLTDGPFTIRSTGNFIFSLLIMPWSVKWQEYDWWNTYDTYNQHDRFN